MYLDGSKIRFGLRNIRFRLTALYVTILTVTLILFSLLLYYVFMHNQRKEFDTALYNYAVDVAQNIDIDVFGELRFDSDILSNKGKLVPFSIGRAYIQVLTPNGKLIARSRSLGRFELPFNKVDFEVFSSGQISLRTLSGKNLPPVPVGSPSDYRLINYAARGSGIGSFVLQIAVPMAQLQQIGQRFFLLFLITVPLTILVACIGGFYLAGRTLKPVQQAFESQERFVADASHQLKTPLAILRGELDVLRSRPRTDKEISEFFESSSQELNYMSRVVEDLLLLARMDAGAGMLNRNPVRLDEVALEAISSLELLASAKNVRIRLNLCEGKSEVGSFEVQGDYNLLRSMLSNLLDNAIKFSPDKNTVDVELKDESQYVSIGVHDQGVGISTEVLPKLFQRFYRAAGEVSSATPGVGLGLAIARQIAQAHGGDIEVQSVPDMGTTLKVRIKKF